MNLYVFIRAIYILTCGLMRETKCIEHKKQKSTQNGLHLPKIGFKACDRCDFACL